MWQICRISVLDSGHGNRSVPRAATVNMPGAPWAGAHPASPLCTVFAPGRAKLQGDLRGRMNHVRENLCRITKRMAELVFEVVQEADGGYCAVILKNEPAVFHLPSPPYC